MLRSGYAAESAVRRPTLYHTTVPAWPSCLLYSLLTSSWQMLRTCTDRSLHLAFRAGRAEPTGGSARAKLPNATANRQPRLPSGLLCRAQATRP